MVQMTNYQKTSAQKIPWLRFSAVVKSYEIGELMWLSSEAAAIMAPAVLALTKIIR